MPANQKQKKRICIAASECVPFAKTGGLADVCGSLPKALAEIDCEVKLFMPMYKPVKIDQYGFKRMDEVGDVNVSLGGKHVEFGLWHGKLPGSDVDVYLVNCPQYFHRDSIYTNDPDEGERFILFQVAVLEGLQRMGWSPDIIHCNDWQTALIPVYLKTNYKWDGLFDRTKSLLSIHNIGYQGRFSSDLVETANLSYSDYYQGGPYEFDGTFSFLKSGILFADVITTVSPTYALEIQTPEYGAGLDGVLSARSDHLFGILNGIDTDVWDPDKDAFIRYNYNVDSIEFKQNDKIDLFKRLEREFDPDIATIGVISRLTGQKGLELMEPIFADLMNMRLQFVILGSGEDKYENFFNIANYSYASKFLTYIGYSNELSHLMTAGCDMILMPSRYEPCGLNQMYALAYGTVPVVRATGGLADTVIDLSADPDNGNGFSFYDFTSDALLDAIRRAVNTYSNRELWHKVMQRGMREDFSWKKSAGKYVELYDKLINNSI
ncbi:MAG: glycogen synthase GlgA [Ignavibacteriae bacterium]|nr:glycogen synthase GlgA [Ignavibacteriota bacterium]